MTFDRQKFIDAIEPYIKVGSLGVLALQKEGINQLLDYFEADTNPKWGEGDIKIERLAYFLATIWHECTVLMPVVNHRVYVSTFHPVEEMGSISYLNRMYDTRTDLGNTRAHDGDGARNAGDGYVQNTGANNARTTGRKLAGTEISWSEVSNLDNRVIAAFTHEGGSQRTPVRVDASTFVRNHELLRVPRISYLDSSDGYLTGRYTGKSIDDYINEDECDYFGARRVINGINVKNKPKVLEIKTMAIRMEKALRASQIEIAGSIAGSEATLIEAPATSDAVELPVADPTPSNSTQTEALTAYIPHIDTAKTWYARLIGGSAVGAVWSFYTGQPIEIRIAVLAFLFLLVGALTFIFIKYHSKVFALVTEVTKLNAANPNSPIQLLAHIKQ